MHLLFILIINLAFFIFNLKIITCIYFLQNVCIKNIHIFSVEILLNYTL